MPGAGDFADLFSVRKLAQYEERDYDAGSLRGTSPRELCRLTFAITKGGKRREPRTQQQQ